MNKNQNFGRRLAFAWSGVLHAFRHERSMRFHCVALLGLLVVLAVTRAEAVWWAILLLAAAAVVATELLNSALEALADHLHPAEHRAIQIAKDCAAGAVLVTSLGAIAAFAAFAIHLLRAST